MSALFSRQLRVRAYECDSLGHVSNSVYLQYLQQVTLDAHNLREPIPRVPMPRTLAVEYQTPARYGDELEISTWVEQVTPGGLTRSYEIARIDDRAAVLRARIGWNIAPGRDTIAHANPRPMKTLTLPRDNGALPWRWRHVVPRYELDMTQSVQLAAYFHWLEEATFRTAHLSGWTMERLRAEDFITLQYRHDAEFFAPANNRDEIEISSRLLEVRRVRGTWLHEIFRVGDDTLLLRDYSTGAFLDWQGTPRMPPPGLMERLMQGEA